MHGLGIIFFAVILPTWFISFFAGVGKGYRDGKKDGYQAGHAEGWSAYHRSPRDNRGRFRK